MPENSLPVDAWEPLVVDAAAESLRAVLSEISASSASGGEGWSLAGGMASRALFRAYLSLSEGYGDSAGQSAGLASRAMISALRDPVPSLYRGVVGPAWVVDHLDGWIMDLDSADREGGVDGPLSVLLEQSPWVYDFDLIDGLAGMGVYALSRLVHTGGRRCLEAVVGRLAESAESRHDGITWLTRSELLPDWQRRAAPHGYYNLGLAHGVPGVVSLLAGASAAGVCKTVVDPLLEGAVAWVLAQRCSARDGPLFPTWIAPGAKIHRGPMHWCYGDPGVAGAVFTAGLVTGRDDWSAQATEIALRAARQRDGTPVADAGICHGSAGLSHLYNRFWQATGQSAFRDAAMHWLERTPALLARTTGDGFLEGRAGVGLVLLAALGIRPDWDVILGLCALRREP